MLHQIWRGINLAAFDFLIIGVAWLLVFLGHFFVVERDDDNRPKKGMGKWQAIFWALVAGIFVGVYFAQPHEIRDEDGRLEEVIRTKEPLVTGVRNGVFTSICLLRGIAKGLAEKKKLGL